MAHIFKVDDHVTWNSDVAHVSGTISKVHPKDVKFKSYTQHASKDDFTAERLVRARLHVPAAAHDRMRRYASELERLDVSERCRFDQSRNARHSRTRPEIQEQALRVATTRVAAGEPSLDRSRRNHAVLCE